MQVRTVVFLRVLFSQPSQRVSLSVSASEVSRCTCSGEGTMQPERQAEFLGPQLFESRVTLAYEQRPQSVQGSQSLTRLGRVKMASP